LYGNGKYYDIQEDVLEKSPLDIAGLNEDQKTTYEMLQSALVGYQDKRPAHLGLPEKK
jgi:hypothetical protein